MKKVTLEDLEIMVKSKAPVLVDFYSLECGPCNRLLPLLEEVEKIITDVEFVKVDVQDHMDYAIEMGVSSLPTLILFKGGEPVKRNVGLISKESLIDFVQNP